MNFAGAAAGASDALQQMLAQRRAAYLQQEQLKLQQSGEARATDALALQKQAHADTVSARNQDVKNESAKVRASLLQPDGSELGAADVSALQGTPYEALLNEQGTLASHRPEAGGMLAQADPGGRKVVTLRPTQQQQAQAGEREGKRKVVELMKRGAPRNEVLAGLAESGQDISASLLNDPQAAIAAQNERSQADRDLRLQIAGMAQSGRADTQALTNEFTRLRIDGERSKQEAAQKDRDTAKSGIASTRQQIRDLAQGLIDDPSLAGITGAVEGRRDTFLSPKAVDALSRFTQLQNSLALGAREKLKGQGAVSNFEAEMLQRAVSALNRAAGPDMTANHLREIVRAFGGDAPTTKASTGGTVRARDPQGVLHEAPAGTPLPAGWKAEQ